MAGNFWQSSHCQKWIIENHELQEGRLPDMKYLSDEDYQKVMIFYANFIQSLGEFLRVRQQVIATATVYFKRFYSKSSLANVDPLLMAVTCIHLSSKVDEFAMNPPNFIINPVNQVLRKHQYAFQTPESSKMFEFPYKCSHIVEAEFLLLETFDCSLIVYHPYRSLKGFTDDIALSLKSPQTHGHGDDLLPLTWRICNDSLRTDVCLLYPPYLIALACVYLACVVLKKDAETWFAELNVDMDKVLEIGRYIIQLYDLWKRYKEKEEIWSILDRIPTPKLR